MNWPTATRLGLLVVGIAIGLYVWELEKADSQALEVGAEPPDAVPLPQNDSAAAPSAEDPAQFTATVLPEAEPSMQQRVQTLKDKVNDARTKLDGLAAQQVVDRLLDAFNDNDDILMNIAKERLIRSGRQGDEAALQSLQTAIGSASPEAQTYLIGILGEIANDKALAGLLEILNSSMAENAGSRVAALDAIAHIGQSPPENVSRETLSGLLEKDLDRAALDDPLRRSAVLSGLSSLGTHSGIEKILRESERLEQAKQMTPELEDSIANNMRALRNPDALPALKSRLQQDPAISRSTTRAAGDALAAMGDAQATEALLQWAAEASGPEQMQQALEWLAQVRDEASLQSLLHADEHLQFRDPQIRLELDRLAKEIESANTPELDVDD